jgi:hypothetical protein
MKKTMLGSVTAGVFLLFQGCGVPIITSVAGLLFTVAVFYGQVMVESAAGKTIEMAFDKVFGQKPADHQLRIVIDPKDHNKATADRLVLTRSNPDCSVELTQVSLRWDAVKLAWNPNMEEIEKFKKACAVNMSAISTGGR